MIRALAVLALIPGPAAAGLTCTFTQLCSPLTDCQDHPGLPFTFDLVSGALALVGEEGMRFGTPLSHLDAANRAFLFETSPHAFLILSLSETGEAVMTQQDFEPGGRITSVSYFGTCRPAA
ncbi:hypothetical protein HKCCE4037_02550 [Rhodobacterales bacterium HKCCE4037]|nr:hypothetical protein [Rhodobacterales bacterium HKCCE4037]